MTNNPIKKSEPFITIAIPVLNEEKFIYPLFKSLGFCNESFSLPWEYEIIFVDGGSTDRTSVMLTYLRSKIKFKVLDNTKKIQSAGINLAAENSNPKSSILVRIDAHAIYEPNFIENVVNSMLDKQAQSVVVPLVTRALKKQSDFAYAVQVAQLSKMGNGGASHRTTEASGQWIDHGHHAAFDLSFYKSIGGYDDTFATNEDAEYDVRVHKAGGKIWFEPKALAWYCPREDLKSLMKQYFKYGIGRANTTLKHSLKPKLRQMFPVAAMIANTLGLILSLFTKFFLLIPVSYLLICYIAAIYEMRNNKDDARRFVSEKAAIALITMHMSWATGFCKTMINEYFKNLYKKSN